MQQGDVRLVRDTLARIRIHDGQTGAPTSAVETELGELVVHEKPGTFLANFTRAKTAPAEFDIALAGPGPSRP